MCLQSGTQFRQGQKSVRGLLLCFWSLNKVSSILVSLTWSHNLSVWLVRILLEVLTFSLSLCSMAKFNKFHESSLCPVWLVPLWQVGEDKGQSPPENLELSSIHNTNIWLRADLCTHTHKYTYRELNSVSQTDLKWYQPVFLLFFFFSLCRAQFPTQKNDAWLSILGSFEGIIIIA